MERQAHIYSRTLEQPVAHHHFRTAYVLAVRAFLGGLETELDRAVQLIAMGMDEFRHC